MVAPGLSTRYISGNNLSNGSKDMDFEMNRLTVRDGKGQKDRITMLPERFAPLLKEHLKQVRAIYEEDLKKGVTVQELMGHTAFKISL